MLRRRPLRLARQPGLQRLAPLAPRRLDDDDHRRPRHDPGRLAPRPVPLGADPAYIGLMADADPVLHRFVPPYPPRGEGPVATWRGFFGERGRTAASGWWELAFRTHYLKRKVIGSAVHIPLRPDLVQH